MAFGRALAPSGFPVHSPNRPISDLIAYVLSTASSIETGSDLIILKLPKISPDRDPVQEIDLPEDPPPNWSPIGDEWHK
jgi:hypothetical protein